MTDEPMSAATTGDLASRGTAQSTALGFETLEGVCAMRAPFRADLVGDPADGGLAGGVVTTLLVQTCAMAVSRARRGLHQSGGTPPRLSLMAPVYFRIASIRPAKTGRAVT